MPLPDFIDRVVSLGLHQVTERWKKITENGQDYYAPVVKVEGLAIGDVTVSQTYATLLDGSKALTTAAAALSVASVPCSAVMVQADPDNAANVLVGNATSQSIVLVPGQAVQLPVNDINKVFARMVAGSGDVNYAGVV